MAAASCCRTGSSSSPPDDLRGQALGLHTSGMLTMQAVAATLAGGVAQVLSPAHAMAVMATASILVSLALFSALRRTDTVAGRIPAEIKVG